MYMSVLYACVWMCHCKYSGLSCRAAGHQGSTQSDLCVTTGFSPFNFPTRGLLTERAGPLPLRSPASVFCPVVVHVLSSYFPGLWDELCVWHVTRDYLDDVCC